VLVKEDDPDGNPWGVKFSTMFHMSNDSGLFRTREELEEAGWTLQGNVFVPGTEKYVPLYEAKMLHQFDNRWATYGGLDIRDVTLEEKQDPEFVAMPRYWVPEEEVLSRRGAWRNPWLPAFRRVARTTDERSAIFTVLPHNGPGDSVFLLLPDRAQAPDVAGLIATLCSIPFDFIVRQKVGGMNFSFYLAEQMPVLPPEELAMRTPWDHSKTIRDWLTGF
jgi:hypothetical protein